MAIVRFDVIKEYVGSSTDKSGVTDMTVGSRFFCLTDGCWYVYTGTTYGWVKELKPTS